MAYAVVHGMDQVVERPRTARECLELVKILEAQAEPAIRILDPDGAEIKLGELEKRQRKEVERQYVAAASAQASFDTRSGSRRPAAGALDRGPIAGVLALLAATVLAIGAIWRYERVGARQPPPSESRAAAPAQPVSPASPQDVKSPEASGDIAGRQTGKRESPAPAPPARRAASYTVVAGDSLRRIAEKAYHDPSRWREIAAANPGLDPRRLRPGNAIKLPQPAGGR